MSMLATGGLGLITAERDELRRGVRRRRPPRRAHAPRHAAALGWPGPPQVAAWRPLASGPDRPL